MSVGIAIEGINGFSDAHLRGGHCAQAVEVAFGFFLEAGGGVFHDSVAALFYLVAAVVRLFNVACHGVVCQPKDGPGSRCR